MKKLKPIVKILIVLVLVLVLVLSLMFFIKINKKVYTAKNITTIFEKNNLVVNDNMASIDDKNVDAYIEARNDQSTFRIEFYEFDNEKSAKKFYKDNTNSLENETGGIQGKVVTNKMGFYKYTLEADEDKALAALDGMLQEFDRIGVGKLEEFRTQQYKKNVEMFGDFSKN